MNDEWINTDLATLYAHFGERFSREQCLADLRLLSCQGERVLNIRGNEVRVKKGQVAISIRTLCKRWGLANLTVQHLLRSFQHENLIKINTSNAINIIDVFTPIVTQSVTQNVTQKVGVPNCNTDSYKKGNTQSVTQSVTQNEKKQPKTPKNTPIVTQSVTQNVTQKEGVTNSKTSSCKTCNTQSVTQSVTQNEKKQPKTPQNTPIVTQSVTQNVTQKVGVPNCNTDSYKKGNTQSVTQSVTQNEKSENLTKIPRAPAIDSIYNIIQDNNIVVVDVDACARDRACESADLSEKERAKEDAFIGELKRAPIWKEQMCMRHKITPSELEAWIETFSLDAECRGTLHDNLTQVKRHFNDWLRIQIREQRKINNENNRPNTKDRRRGFEVSACDPADYTTTF